MPYSVGETPKKADPLEQVNKSIVALFDLWGLGKAGYRCKDCNIACHKDCKNHVVMECRPGNRQLTSQSFKTEKNSKLKKKRLKYAEQAWMGSTDSQLSATSDVESPSTPPRLSSSSDLWTRSLDNHPAMEIRLREKVILLEREKMQLKRENEDLRKELSAAQSKISSLTSQMSLVRQQSMKFLLEQMERLNTVKQTDV